MNQVITGILISNATLLILIFGFSWKLWLPYIRPDLFYIYRIFRNDFLNYDEKLIFTPVKGKTTSYTFNKNEYSHLDVKPFISPNGVYTWNFKEGLAKPITFLNAPNIDARLLNEAKHFKLDDIWFSGEGIQDFIAKYGILLVLVVLGVIFLYMNFQNQQTTKILLNMTGAR